MGIPNIIKIIPKTPLMGMGLPAYLSLWGLPVHLDFPSLWRRQYPVVLNSKALQPSKAYSLTASHHCPLPGNKRCYDAYQSTRPEFRFRPTRTQRSDSSSL